MNKKSFKNPAAAFLSEPEQEEPTIEKVEGSEEIKIPDGYVLAKEKKTARMQLLLRPTIRKKLKQAASDKKMSVNNLMDIILEDYLRKENYYND